MKHLFIPYELAVIAKEKGFNEPCFAYFQLSHVTEEYKFFFVGYNDHNGDRCWYSNYVGIGLSNSEMDRNPVGRLKKCLTSPMYQQIVDWFREKHKIQIKIIAFTTESQVKWYYECQDLTLVKSKHTKEMVFKFKVPSPNISNSYYEALNKAIEEAFKLI